MSDALDYLLKVRPEAMGHYFEFMREAGSHLDPKTRSLISIITKVHAQTEAGFRQYLRRALKDGATPLEIIDALLMAFPALGLTKVVWAVDLLLKMDLPQFRAETLTHTASWHVLGAVEQFVAGKTARIDVDDKALFVYRPDDGFRVYDARCPHQDTLMFATDVRGTRLNCARHGWLFDLEDGRCLVGNAPLQQFPSKVADGVVTALW